jgi:hypothetical protein
VVTHTQTIFISAADSLDKFTRYPLSKALLVGDSLFIGIQQTGVVPIYVGLDKSQDTGDRIYFNTSGSWESNTRVKGSLMLRPVFASTDDIITDIDENPDAVLRLYPNPISAPLVRIDGDTGIINAVEVIDLTGRVLPSRFDKSGKVIEFSTEYRGIYIVKLKTDHKVYRNKIILK